MMYFYKKEELKGNVLTKTEISISKQNNRIRFNKNVIKKMQLNPEKGAFIDFGYDASLDWIAIKAGEGIKLHYKQVDQSLSVSKARIVNDIMGSCQGIWIYEFYKHFEGAYIFQRKNSEKK